MKLYILVLIVYVISMIGCKSNSEKLNSANIRFKEKEIDLKILPYKKVATCNFEYENSGETPLIIIYIKTSCGCAVAQWTKQPIMPGRKDKIEIRYNASHSGRFLKTVLVYYNGPESPAKLVLKGNVEYPE